MSGFSWVKLQEKALQVKLRRAKIKSKGQVNSDWDKDHPDFVRDAQQKNYTQLIKKITEKHKLHLEKVTRRREKLGKII